MNIYYERPDEETILRSIKSCCYVIAFARELSILATLKSFSDVVSFTRYLGNDMLYLMKNCLTKQSNQIFFTHETENF